MKLALILMAIIAAIEILLYTPLIWKFSARVSSILVYLVPLASIFLLVSWFSAGSFTILILSIYRSINLYRIVKQRLQVDFAYNSAKRATLWLIFGQLLVFCLGDYAHHSSLSFKTWLDLLAVCELLALSVLLTTLKSNIQSIKYSSASNKPLPKDELPSLSVLIPARNETTQLETCLTSLLASTYPKLEIIVLDDCSQDKRTPEIIRSFAQSGIRFIAGEIPSDTWLAKNFAYKQLESQSNGELMLFCGVDTTFEPNSLTNIVELLINSQRDMLSILPHNSLSKVSTMKALLIQPVRYAWELILPRVTISRPPVLSTCWLIRRSALNAQGGFDAVSRKIVPESYFARQTATDGNGYRFIESNKDLSVKSSKRFEDQRDTAIRTRYPQLHRKIELIAALSLAELLIFVWPVIGFILGICFGSLVLILSSLASLVITSLISTQLSDLAYRRFILLSLLSLPLAIVYDIAALNYSMWQYEFSEVLWKGRNVCIPVMRVMPKLMSPNSNWVQKR
jgi:glycosyltransferase involved in cell wall biosynthesis